MELDNVHARSLKRRRSSADRHDSGQVKRVKIVDFESASIAEGEKLKVQSKWESAVTTSSKKRRHNPRKRSRPRQRRAEKRVSESRDVDEGGDVRIPDGVEGNDDSQAGLVDPTRQMDATVSSPQPASRPIHPVLAHFFTRTFTLRSFLTGRLCACAMGADGRVAKKIRRRARYVAAFGVESDGSKGQKDNRSKADVDVKTALVDLLDRAIVALPTDRRDHTLPKHKAGTASGPGGVAHNHVLDGLCLLPSSGSSASTDSSCYFLDLNGPSESHPDAFVSHDSLIDHVIWKVGNRIKSSNLLLQPDTFNPGADLSKMRESESVKAVRRAPWSLLFNLVGGRIECQLGLVDLLANTSIFVPAPGSPTGSLVQLVGERIVIEFAALQSSAHKPDGKVKAWKPLTQVSVRRAKMLYGRPAINQSGEVKFGLPHSHMLNRATASGPSLIQNVFPRRFGSQSPFAFDDPAGSTVPARAAPKPRAEGGKVPPRLAKVARLLEQSRSRHRHCSYSALLNYYCPVSSSSAGTESSLTAAATPIGQVAAFCQAVVATVFPDALWDDPEPDDKGRTRTNRKKIMNGIARFVRLGRQDSMSVHELVSGIQTLNMRWTRHSTITTRRDSQPDFRLQNEMIQDLLFYLFDYFVVPLVRAHFFVTDASADPTRHRLYFFRHDVWRRLTAPALYRLRQSIYEELPRTKSKALIAMSHGMAGGKHTNSWPVLGVGAVRIQPKATGPGIRPIVNLRRRQPIIYPSSSGSNKAVMFGRGINSCLQPVGSIIRFEIGQQPDVLRSAISGSFEIPDRLDKFADSLRRDGRPALPRLYFAKADVKGCYDNLSQQKVVRCVRRLLTRPAYRIRRLVRLSPDSGRPVDQTGDPDVPKPVLGDDWLRRVHQTDAGPEYGTLKSTRRPVPESRIDVIVEQASKTRELPATMAKRLLRPGEEVNDYAVIPTPAVIRMVRQHVTGTVLAGRLGSTRNKGRRAEPLRVYKQTKGIPQGSVLSSVLCNLLLAEFEKAKLSFIGDDPESTLIRFVDDFLVVSTKKDVVAQFLDVMHAGSDSFGVLVEPRKSLVNFAYSSVVGESGLQIQQSNKDWFPFCGVAINTQSLLIRRPGTASTHIGAPATNRHRHPGASFFRRSLSAFRLRLASLTPRGIGQATRDLNPERRSEGLHILTANIRDTIVDAARRASVYWLSLTQTQQAGWTVLARMQADVTILAAKTIRRSVSQSRKMANEPAHVFLPLGLVGDAIRWVSAKLFLREFNRLTNVRMDGFVAWLDRRATEAWARMGEHKNVSARRLVVRLLEVEP